jgi:predicted PurR-regulated permease PerM
MSAFDVVLLGLVVLVCAVLLAVFVKRVMQAVEGVSRQKILAVILAVVVIIIEAPLLLIVVALFAEEINYVLARSKSVSEQK